MAIPQDLLRSEELIYFRHANGWRILLQAIGCYCYWLSSVSLSIQADTIVCILRALQHSLYPPTSNRREGRCWQRLEDRWWWVVGLRTGKIGAALWARSRPCSYEGETNWSDSDKWTISASPTASFMSLKLLSHPQSLPCTPPPPPPPFSSWAPSTPILFILTYHALFFLPHFPLAYIFTFLLFSQRCSFTSPTITFPILFLLCCLRSIGGFCIWRGPAAFYYAVILLHYLVHIIDRLILAHHNYFPASVSCHQLT